MKLTLRTQHWLPCRISFSGAADRHIAHQSLLRPVMQSKTKDTPHIIAPMKNNIFVANLIG